MRVASECVEGYWLNHQVLTLKTEICQNCSLFLNNAKLRIFPHVIAGVSSFAMSQFRYLHLLYYVTFCSCALLEFGEYSVPNWSWKTVHIAELWLAFYMLTAYLAATFSSVMLSVLNTSVFCHALKQRSRQRIHLLSNINNKIGPRLWK